MSKADRLADIVSREAFHWGEAVSEAYHGLAASHMDGQWAGILKPFFDRHPFDLSRAIDFAAGYGRNSRKLLEAGAGHVTAIDVNPDCIAVLRASLPAGRFSVIQNDGASLTGVDSETFSFLYSYDAMVHFDLEIVVAYMPEFARVLKPGAYALIHHSNYAANPGEDFRDNPHWRNFMAAGVFKHIAARCGFIVAEQVIFSWGEAIESDCITVMRKA
jgi:SAM-dependent methyltransferase